MFFEMELVSSSSSFSSFYFGIGLFDFYSIDKMAMRDEEWNSIEMEDAGDSIEEWKGDDDGGEFLDDNSI